MTKQSHPSLQDDRFTIRVSKNDGATNKTVVAPLPDNFGFTVGSQFSAPFDAQFISGTAAKGLALAGVSSKLGTATKKLYTSPEPTEISFDMNFEAYESAWDDVYAPVIILMSMAIGSQLTLTDAANTIEELVNRGAANLGRGPVLENTADRISQSSVGQNGERAFDFLNFVQGPPTVKLRFGNVITFRNAYISSVAPSFSNIMDSSGIPMSCVVSVTSILETDPVMDDENFQDFFGQVNL